MKLKISSHLLSIMLRFDIVLRIFNSNDPNEINYKKNDFKPFTSITPETIVNLSKCIEYTISFNSEQN